MAKLNFNINEYENVSGDFDAFEEGEYIIKAVNAEQKETNDGTGEYISGEFEVVGPTNTGRHFWTNFNVVNKSEKAQNFGRRMLASWARSCGKPNAKDTNELLGRKFSALIVVEKGTNGYKDKNVIGGFLEASTEPASFTSAATESVPTPEPEKAVDPFEGMPPHIKVAVEAAGGLGTPAGDATFNALKATVVPATPVATPVAAPPATSPAPAAAKLASIKQPAAASGPKGRAPWDD